MAPLALVTNLVTRWHSCISSKFGHQMAPLESLALPHCLGLPYWHYQLVLSWYLHQLESHQLSWTKHLLVSQWEKRTHRWDPRDTSVRWKSSQGEKNLKAVILWNVFSFTYYKHSTFVGISTYTQFQDNISQLPMYERKKTCKTNFKFSGARY